MWFVNPRSLIYHDKVRPSGFNESNLFLRVLKTRKWKIKLSKRQVSFWGLSHRQLPVDGVLYVPPCPHMGRHEKHALWCIWKFLLAETFFILSECGFVILFCVFVCLLALWGRVTCSLSQPWTPDHLCFLCPPPEFRDYKSTPSHLAIV